MTRSDKLLCLIYAIIALAALVTTQVNNLAFLIQPNNGGALGLVAALYASPAASFTNDLLFYALAGSVFMAVEGHRLGLRHVWVYVFVLSPLAISFAFPLFLIARQMQLARQRPRPAH